jgi:hypothetical protein
LIPRRSHIIPRYESEKLVQCLEILIRRTSIIIAHRLSTIRMPIKFSFRQWKISEQGTHQELLTRKWYLKNLSNLQFSNFKFHDLFDLKKNSIEWSFFLDCKC